MTEEDFYQHYSYWGRVTDNLARWLGVPHVTALGVGPISMLMCTDCQTFYSKAAVSKGRDLTVKDPVVTRVFKADGTVEIKGQK